MLDKDFSTEPYSAIQGTLAVYQYNLVPNP